MRTRIAEVRVVGRATQGVTLIGLDDGDVLSGVQKVMMTMDEEGEDLEDGTIEATPAAENITETDAPTE